MGADSRKDETVHLKAAGTFLSNVREMKKAGNTMAAVYVTLSVMIYLAVFVFTAWILSSMAGWPLLPSVGLLFFLRLCLT